MERFKTGTVSDTLINSKKVKTAGWGAIYVERREDPDVKKHSTSCVTNNQGPRLSHYQPCIAQDVSMITKYIDN